MPRNSFLDRTVFARRRRLVSYLLAVVSVLLALSIRLAAWPILGTQAPFLVFVGALVITAWYGGLGPGLVASLLSAILADYFLLPPLHTLFPRSFPEFVWLASFCGIGALVSWLMQNLHTMTRKAGEASLEVRKSEAELRTILEALPVGVWVTDRNGKFIFGNAAAHRIWGGARYVDINHYEDYKIWWLDSGKPVAAPERPLALALRNGESRIGYATQVETFDGRRKILSNSAVPVKDFDGQILGAILVNEDITDRHRTAEILQTQQRLLDTIFDNILAGVAYLDRDFNFVRVNSTYAQQSGYSAPDLIGRNHFDLFPDPENRAIFEKVRDTREIYIARAREFEFAHQPERGKTYWDWWLCAIPDAQGGTAGLVLSLVDVTDTERARRNIEQLNMELRQADRRKDEFLAMLSHELRNPLAAIQNAVTIVKLRGPDEAGFRSAATIAERQVKHMVRLLEDLLDVSRVTMGKIKLKRERVDLGSILMRAIELKRPQIQEARQNLALSFAPEHVVIDADAARLEQVFNNLLDNAAKYTPSGGQISVSLVRAGNDGIVTVQDNGIGLSGELQAHVFDLFVQGERPIDRSQGGLGIGLTLSRSIVEMHGGRVEVHSEGSGRGTTFTIQIPLAAEGVSAAEPIPEKKIRENKRIIVVEDKPDSAEMLRVVLEADGHEVRVAHDGLSAVTLATLYGPDVMLIDIGLPGMDGHEVARRIRSNSALKSVRLIALTGYGRDEDVRNALNVGFDKHLTKPADMESLREAITT